ncbi:uncharacterized protein LOC100180027 [Ciona intestinalis]
MPNYNTPGHPYASQSIHVTSSPLYKSKDGRYTYPGVRDLTSRPLTALNKTSPHDSESSSPRSPRAKTAPPGYKTMPPINKNKKLITLNFRQLTPWCRDMYRWFTPDPSQGVWHDKQDVDRYRREALKSRIPAQNIYHTQAGLMPNYSGYVPGQKFRYGKTWARETVNANRTGIPRTWESTSFFQDRPIGA